MIDKFVTDYPGLSVSILLGLGALVIALAKLLANNYHRRIEERFKAMSQRNTAQDGTIGKLAANVSKLDGVPATLARMEAHFGACEERARERHDKLFDAVASLVTSHEVLAQRVETLEKKMPNGELKTLASAYEKLAEQKRARSRKS